MVEPLSVASGVAGIITLSSAVVAAGYKYLNSTRSAPADLKSLVQEVASLNTLTSQFVTLSLSGDSSPRPALKVFTDQGLLQDCQQTLTIVQKHLQDCEPVPGSRGKNALKKLSWPMRREDIIKRRERISRFCAILTTALTHDNASSLTRIEQTQRRSIEQTGALVDNSHVIEERKVLGWLSAFNPRAKHVATTLLQQPDSCDWLLQKQAIIDWIHEGGFIWLYGPSGCGKTVLISSIIENLRASQSSHEPQKMVAYHYCEFANVSTLDPLQTAGSLVRQLAKQMRPFPQVVRDAYHKHSRNPPSLRCLVSLLLEIVKINNDSIYIIIDGLDECPDRAPFVRMLEDMRASPNNTSHINIMVSSRPEFDLHRAWSSGPSVSISPQDVEQSLEVHVRNEIARMPKLMRIPSPSRRDLVATLVSRADGMFRWIQCQFDALETIRTPNALQRALTTLPEGLHETYDRILCQIQQNDQEYVIRALKWLIGTYRPLTVEELAEAIAIDPCKSCLDIEERLMDPEDLFDLCGSLLRIESDRVVVLAHYSVKEYLLSEQLKSHLTLASFSISEQNSVQHISICLLTYMVTVARRIQQLQTDYLDEREFPLFSYARDAPTNTYLDHQAAEFWFDNYLELQVNHNAELATLINYTQPPAPFEGNYADSWNAQMCIQACLMCYWDTMIKRDLAGPSSSTKNRRLIEDLFIRLQRDWDNPVNTQTIMTQFRGEQLVSPLCTAAFRGFSHAARLLLEKGAKVNGTPPPYHLGNPLMLALKYNREDVVNVLSDFHADFDIRSPARIITTPLLSSLTEGIHWQLLNRLIDEKKLKWNSIDLLGRSVHYWIKYDTYIKHEFNHELNQHENSLHTSTHLDAEFHDKQVLYTTILMLLNSMRGVDSVCHHFGRSTLAQCLNNCGFEYLEYVAVFFEQGIVRRRGLPMVPYYCNNSTWKFNGWLHDKAFRCLHCLNTDLCAGCYESWQKSDGKMEVCKGHTFYEIPRACWYTFEPGIVTEDGKKLPEVIEELEKHFSGLLDGVLAVELPTVPS